MEGKKPGDSAVESRYLLMPHQANPYGTAFGGVIMAWIDMIASMAAQRHCGKEVVTASIDSLSFKEPIRLGDHVVLKACVNYVGRTSMEVGVRIEAEAPMTGETKHVASAYLTFVCLDEQRKPKPIPPLILETEFDKRRNREAQARREVRLRERRK